MFKYKIQIQIILVCLLLLIGFNASIVLADDEKFRIRVVVQNDGESIDNGLEENNDIDLDDNDDDDDDDNDDESENKKDIIKNGGGGYNIVNADVDDVNLSEYDLVLEEYKKWMFDINLFSDKTSVFIDEKFPISMEFLIASDNSFDIDEYIVDAYVIIRNQNGIILNKQDLLDVANGIDFLKLRESSNIQAKLERYFGNNLMLPKQVGKYSIELVMVFSGKFLDIDKKIASKYQIEVRSNKMNIEIKQKHLEFSDKTVNTRRGLFEWVYVVIFVIAIIFGWLMRIMYVNLVKNKDV